MRFTIVIFMLLSFTSAVVASANDAFPTERITQTVPWSAGGGTDRFARVLRPLWEEELKSNVVVSNVPGAGTTIGNNKVWESPNEGHHLLVANIGAFNFSGLLHETEWEVDDWAFIGLHHKDPNLVYARSDLPVDNMDELIAYAKRNPGEITIGVPGVNNDQRIMLELLERQAGVDFGSIVPAGGGGALLKEVMGGHIDVGVHRAYAGGERAREAGLKPLGVAADRRTEIWPDAPTFKESLRQEWQIEGEFYGFKGYAVPVVVKEEYPKNFQRLVRAFKKLVESDRHSEVIRGSGLEYVFEYLGPEEADSAVQKYDEMVRENKNLFQ